MTTLVLFPLLAFFVNVFLALFILYKDPHRTLNRLYALIAISLAIWSIGEFLQFSSLNATSAFFWSKIITLGSGLTAVFTLHFFLIFTKNPIVKKPLLSIIYIPVISFEIVNFLTPLIYESVRLVHWGFSGNQGPLFFVYALYVAGYTLIGIILAFRFSLQSHNTKEKKQARNLALAFSIPLVGGTITQILLPALEISLFPLATTLTTVTAIIVAFTIKKYKLMTPLSLSIQRKLIIGFLLISLLIGIVGFVMVSISQQALRDAIGHDQITLASETLNKIERTVASRVEEFRTLTVELHLLEFINESNNEFDKMHNRQDYIDQKDREWVSAPAQTITPFMESIIENEFSNEFRALMGFYKQDYERNVIGEVFITNKYGANVIQTGKTSDYRQDDEEWWHLGREKGVHVTDVLFDESAGIYSADIIIRLDDPNGNFLGMMKVVHAIDEVFFVLQELEQEEKNRGRTIGYDLINDKGQLLYSTGEFAILKNVSHLLTYQASGLEHQNDFFAIHDDEHGTERLYAHAHSKNPNDRNSFNWILILSRPTAEIFIPIAILTNTIIFFSFMIALAAFLLGLSISRSISRPVNQLKKATANIAAGNLNTKINITSRDEIGDLASSFTQMTHALKASQQKIKKHAKDLEMQVSLRTKDLNEKVQELTKTKSAVLNMMEDMEETNRELIQTKNKLEIMDNKKDQFISIAAHELKTPLTSIHGFSQLLRNKKVAGNSVKREKYLKIMDHETKRLANLVNDILDLSRIDLGTLKFVLEDIKIAELIETIQKEMNIQMKNKGLTGKYKIDKKATIITSDRERLTQILLNLINNAVKYTIKGSITVEVKKEDRFTHFIIRDTGVGIAKQNLEKIFDRFYQVDSTYTRKVGGTGLGLSLVKEFIENLGGKIWVKSQVGKGTEFHFTLPEHITETELQEIRKRRGSTEPN